jgi:hypothetical protein
MGTSSRTSSHASRTSPKLEPLSLTRNRYASESSSSTIKSTSTSSSRENSKKSWVLPKDFQPLLISGGYLLVDLDLPASSWRDVARELGGNKLAKIEKGMRKKIADRIWEAVKEARVLVGSWEDKEYDTTDDQYVYLFSKERDMEVLTRSKTCMMLFEDNSS